MRRKQRLCHIALALGALVCGGTAWGQVPTRTFPPAQLIVEPRREVTQALDDARLAITRKQYHSAVQLLQRVLDQPEDRFVVHDFLADRGNRGGTWKEALRLLTSTSGDGQTLQELATAYELEYGAAARQLLTKALEVGDTSRLAEVARRFTATAAGYDATILLAAAAADGNRPLEGALLLEILRNHPRRTPQLSLQRAVYWSRAGRSSRAMAALRELRRIDPSGKMRIAGRDVVLPTDEEESVQWLRSLAPRDTAATPSEVATWSLVGGGPSRNSSAAPASPAGGNTWRVSTLEHLSLDGRDEEDRRNRTRFQEALDRGLLSMMEENRPILPAAQPLVIGDTVVYRTVGDVTAISLQTGELLWRSSVVDESLIRLLNTRIIEARIRQGRGYYAPTLEGHLERRVYRDVAAGTLSSDGRTVFALEELDGNSNISVNAFGVSESRPSNKLVGYDLTGGRLLWEAGGPLGTKPAELSARFFLGSPLPLNDRLYVIAEEQGALQLLVLNQDADRQAVSVDWSLTLVATDPPLSGHPLRRLSGISPSFCDGILVCPTSSGAVVAVDEARRSLLWGFQYPSLVHPEPQNIAMFDRAVQQEFRLVEADKSGRWMDSTPLIADGVILVTPRDSDRLFCLDLVDGHEIWQMSRDDWMYVACEFEGRVVLVGRHGLGAVQLSDGTALDTFAISDVEPTGRGVRIGSAYCLPTASGEIATIDLRTGQVLARSKLSSGLVPGNLAAGSGTIVSQSVNEIIGFSSLSSIDERIATLSAAPDDPQALALRGELRLHRGEEAAGLSDLRESLKRKPDSHAKAVLATALLAGARAKPDLIRERVTELESITDDPQQRNEFLRLYSQALEAAGDRSGAFVQMIRLAETSKFLDALKPVEPGYSVRTDRSIRARLIEMYSAASPEERVDLDRALEQHLRKAASTQSGGEQLERIRNFFSGLPGAEAILLQSAVQIAGSDNVRRQELLRIFLRSADPTVAAQATGLQCRDLIKSQQWPAAAVLVRRLQGEFADRECLDGKSGRDLATQWSTQTGLSQLLDNPAVWPEGQINALRVARESGIQRSSLPAEIVASSGTLMAGWSFEIDTTGTQLLARDAAGVFRWKLLLPNDGEYNDAELRNAQVVGQIHVRDNWLAMSRLTYFMIVDVAAAPAPRIAWYQMLKPSGVATTDLLHPIRRNGRFTQRQTTSLGQLIGVTRETVIYSVGVKLMASELQTGRLVWSRQNSISSQIEASADDALVAIQSSGTVTLLRTLDGVRIAKKPLPSTSLWNHGSLLLVFRSKGDVTTFELRNLERDSVVWTQECPINTVATVVDDEDVAFLQPDGRLLMVRLADKKERYRSELPVKLGTREKSWFVIQRCPDRDVVLTGERNGLSVDANGTLAQSMFDGFVCGVSRGDGRLQWAKPVEKAAFDRTQPVGLPVLLLASRQPEGRNGANPFLQRFRMTAELIDKRSGRIVYFTDETSFSPSPRFEPDTDHARIFVNFHDWQLDLSFPDGKVVPEKK